MNKQGGFTLIEALIAMVAFGVFMWGLIGAFHLVVEITRDNQRESEAMAIALRRVEAVRNMAYDDIGVTGGIPPGVLPNIETVPYDNINYTVLYDVRYIDDPFDGELGAGDDMPTDYKQVRVEVGVQQAEEIEYSVVLVTNVAPPGLETDVGGGSLLVEVFNSVNDPVQGARVHIVNNDLAEPIDVIGLSNDNGRYFVLGAPTSTEHYEIIVSKEGHSSARTYGVSLENPTPDPPHMSVFEGLLSSKSFFIDSLSTMRLRTFDDAGLSQNWWNSAYAKQVPLTISNTGTVDLPAGMVLSVSVDHAALVAGGGSLASGDDVRVLRKSGSTWNEVDRVASWDTWNTASTTLWFRLADTIPVSGSTDEYYLYSDNALAIDPASVIANIFAPDVSTANAVWYAEDGTGTELSESSAGLHHGAMQGTDETAWVAGRHGGGIAFDGLDDCVVVTHHEDLSPATPFTVETWVKPFVDTPPSTLIEKSSGALHHYALSVQDVLGEKFLEFTYEDNGLDVTLTHPNVLTQDAWTHVAAVVSASDVTLYVDGAASVPTPFTAAPQVNTNDVTIGCDDQSRFFKGELDAIAISASAKTEFPSSAQGFDAVQSGPNTFTQGSFIGSVNLTMTGSKTIGTDGLGEPIPKTVLELTTDATGLYEDNVIEYDTYGIVSDGVATGYDIAGSLPHLPFVMSAGVTQDVALYLAPHEDHTLLLFVQDSQGDPITGATVRLEHALTSYDEQINTSFTGQSFFSPLSVLTYDATVSADGYQEQSFPLEITGQTAHIIQLADL